MAKPRPLEVVATSQGKRSRYKLQEFINEDNHCFVPVDDKTELYNKGFIGGRKPVVLNTSWNLNSKWILAIPNEIANSHLIFEKKLSLENTFIFQLKDAQNLVKNWCNRCERQGEIQGWMDEGCYCEVHERSDAQYRYSELRQERAALRKTKKGA